MSETPSVLRRAATASPGVHNNAVHASGRYTSVGYGPHRYDHPVHALVLWQDGVIEQVWGIATAWTAGTEAHEPAVHVTFHTTTPLCFQWEIWFLARYVTHRDGSCTT